AARRATHGTVPLYTGSVTRAPWCACHVPTHPLDAARLDFRTLDLLSLVDGHHVLEELERLVLGTLEGVAAHDGAEPAALLDPLDLLHDGAGVLGLASGEDDDPLPVERGLHHVLHAV